MARVYYEDVTDSFTCMCHNGEWDTRADAEAAHQSEPVVSDQATIARIEREMMERGPIAAGNFVVCSRPARRSVCNHGDYDANGRCYSCGKIVARSVESYL